MAHTVNRRLTSDAIRRAIYLERYKSHEVNGVLTFMHTEVVPDMLRRINARLESGRAGTWSSEILVDLTMSNQQMLRGGLRYATGQLQENLSQFAVHEDEWQRRTIENAVPISIDLNAVSPQLLKSMVVGTPFDGRTLTQWMNGVADATASRITLQVRLGIAEGESIDQIMARIKGLSDRDLAAFGGNTIAEMNRNIRSVVRTAVGNVSAKSREATYAANSDVIKGVQMVATLDSRTTPYCRAIDGEVFPIDEGPRPPFHFNCRTTTIPVTKSWKELGIKHGDTTPATRASMFGEVPGKTTYSGWLKTQSPAFQNEVLGPVRAELFRRGQVDLAGFVDHSGRTLTLTELRSVESEAAWDAAVMAMTDEEKVAAIKRLIADLDQEVDPDKKKGIRAKLRRLDPEWQQYRGGVTPPPPPPPPPLPPPPPPPAPEPQPAWPPRVISEEKGGTGLSDWPRETPAGPAVRARVIELAQTETAQINELKSKLAVFEKDGKNFDYFRTVALKELENVPEGGFGALPMDLRGTVDHRANELYIRYIKERLAIQDEISSLQRKLKSRVMPVIEVPSADRLTIEFGGDYLTSFRGQASWKASGKVALEWLNRVASRRMFPRDQRSFFISAIKERGRAFYRQATRSIHVAKSDLAGTWIHEVGHAFEYNSPGVYRAAKDFLARRTVGEVPQKLSKLQPGLNYRKDEIARPDKFKSPYMGKLYPDATEIVSMGIEWLYKDPYGFAVEDPEYFELIVNILRGTLP